MIIWCLDLKMQEVHGSDKGGLTQRHQPLQNFLLNPKNSLPTLTLNTFSSIQVSAMVELEYKTLANFMVNTKGYSDKHLLQPLDVDFLQKGLIVDIYRGNLLKISCDGYILKATHGTKFMTDSEIVDVYGPARMWDVTTEFTRNILVSWIGQYADTIRTLADYFDMPSSLIFARAVDAVDEKAGEKVGRYTIWPDVLDGLIHMYTREHFESGVSEYFNAIRANPDLYIHRTKPDVINFLKKLKAEKSTFLITGSNIDLANLTAAYCLGDDWRELFDIVVCFAKKPGFFNASRPFVKIDGVKETVAMDPNDLELNQVYSQGNWVDLDFALSKKRSIKNPKMLYFGDNIIQDVYAPTKFTTYDSVAIVEELLAEGMKDVPETHVDKKLLTSSLWGPYFGTSVHPTIWSEIIREHSKICVPNVDAIAKNPIDYAYKSFTGERSCRHGFYPNEPEHWSD